MKKIVLVDGNNLLFRSYYATAYNGNLMKNNEGLPTNGLYGFVNMINKIINEEKPEFMLVAFDVGKTFRHEEYIDYKGGRDETPSDLKVQFPYAKELLDELGIKHLEVVGYEADDIVGTFARLIDESTDYEGLIVSSDKDLLQLISDKVTVKLLKSKDYIMMTKDTFKETYGIEPIRMIDLKGLMGDASDNIPGVKGIGEKTALKLLGEYDTIENLYANIDNIKGATKTKLTNDIDNAYKSKKLATIYKEVPINITIEDTIYEYKYTNTLIELYKKLGFTSLIKKLEPTESLNKKEKSLEVFLADTNTNLTITKPSAIYLDIDKDNYHHAKIIGISIYNENTSLYVPKNLLSKLVIEAPIYTYDAKKLYVSLKKNNITIPEIDFDVMIASHLLNYNVKDDIAVLASSLGEDIDFTDRKKDLTIEEIMSQSIKKAKFIYELTPKLKEELIKEEVDKLFKEIELPLSIVLAKMEYEGINCDSKVLDEMGEAITTKIKELTKIIYDLSDEEFNISSPLQLGEVLFEKLALPHGKKNKRGYATDEATLSKLKGYPIIDYILEYRMLTKLYSTYIEGLKNNITADGKIHTIYNQTLTRTGRLSSIEPNLQNIPVRNEYGRLIRKSFIPEENSLLLSSDYSQIELRMFAHLAGETELIKAFNNKKDIHTKTASDIYNVPQEEVTKEMRRNAKAVNFGIIYGISSYGLATDLSISNTEAKNFIEKYFEAYPGIKEYMTKTKEEAYKNGYVKTIMNRKRIIDELNNTNYMIRSMGERMALNTGIQGSSAEILKMAMIEIDKQFTTLNLKSKMILQIHDELVFNVKTDELDKVLEIVKNTMENIITLTVPLEVELSTGNNLYEAK